MFQYSAAVEAVAADVVASHVYAWLSVRWLVTWCDMVSECHLIGFYPRSHENAHGLDSRQFSAHVGISMQSPSRTETKRWKTGVPTECVG